MADARPFRGFRYDRSAVGALANVVCPPYDIISPGEARALRQRSPYNAVNLELPEDRPGDTPDHNRHTRAAGQFRRWVDAGVLDREATPAVYLFEEEFALEGRNLRRRGMVAVVRLEEFEHGIIMPHEYTTPGPKADRLALMKAAQTNFSPIMSLYRDAEGAVASLLDGARQGEPAISADPEGLSRYNLWPIADPDVLSKISEAMGPLQLFVADGHHRYETALQYRDELESSEGPLSPRAAARYVMMTLIPMDDPGLLVLPYHRVFGGLASEELDALRHGIERAFKAEAIEVPTDSAGATARAIEARLAAKSPGEVVVTALGLEPGRAHMLTLRDSYMPAPDSRSLEKCDVWILHRKAISPALGEEAESSSASFVHDIAEAVGDIQNGSGQVAFLLRPLPMDLFEVVVGKGERLPAKSTYFYPKLPTGLVINSLRGEL